ncbi:hypothetical protein [Actinomadura rifamycini]|uniref:hypothetical protein n=1 Tax=Actinomadura rifamycini TaxID=31962 RepID=UPI00041BB750|nr:hypothetical protein [Actinomadura rifamycini]
MRSGRRERLLARAVRDKFRGPGWDRLRKAGESGDQSVVDALWACWLDRDPHDALLRALRSWGRPARGDRRARSVVALGGGTRPGGERTALLAAALVRDHPIGAIARDLLARTTDPDVLRDALGTALDAGPGAPLAGVLAARDDLPRDPPALAELFLVTGRGARYRALDPDGTHLARAYAAAGEHRRERLREAMLRAGDLDVVRVVTARDRDAGLGAGERRDLARALLESRRWEEAWRTAKRLPLADAAAVARALPAGWRPAPADRRVLALLRAAPPRLHDHVAVLADADRRTVRVGGLADRLVEAGAFSPDARFMVVGHLHRGMPSDPRTVQVFTLDGGVASSAGRHVVDGGTPRFALTEHGAAIAPEHDERAVWWLPFADRRPERLPVRDRVTHLAPVPGGFVVAGVTDDREVRLHRFDRAGRPSPDGPLTVADLPFLTAFPPARIAARADFAWAYEVFADPVGGRVAFHSRAPKRIVVIEPDARVVADSAAGHARQGSPWARATPGCFTAPDRLFSDGRLIACTPDGGLRDVAVLAPRPHDTVGAVVHLPATGELLGASPGRPYAPGTAWYADATTLEPVRDPRPPAGLPARAVWATPDGAVHAVGRETVTVVDEAVRAAAGPAVRPLDELTAADLGVLADLRRRARPGASALRTVVGLLHDVLEAAPVGADVALGGASAPAGGPDDIALGGT